MNILHVIESLEFGGAEKVVIHLANRQAERCPVTICLVKSRGDLVAEISDEINVIYLDLGEGVHFDLPGKLRKIIDVNQIEVVNAHNWGIYFETYLAVRKSRSTQLILTVHGPYTQYEPGLAAFAKRKLRHFCERIATRSVRVKKIVTVSDSIQSYILSDIGLKPGKLVTIHNGIKPLVVKNTPGNDDCLRLITVGRLAAIKNHTMMLDAVNLVRQEGAKVYLTIVGDGPERTKLEGYARDIGVSDQVSFLGFRNDIGTLLAAHDVFVLSSDYEGISIALLEAMSLSKPAVATNVGGVPEMILHEYSGLMVEKGDTRGFSEAIIKLQRSEPTRVALGKNAYQYFSANFHEDIVIDKYDKLYASCSG